MRLHKTSLNICKQNVFNTNYGNMLVTYIHLMTENRKVYQHTYWNYDAIFIIVSHFLCTISVCLMNIYHNTDTNKNMQLIILHSTEILFICLFIALHCIALQSKLINLNSRWLYNVLFINLSGTNDVVKCRSDELTDLHI